MKKGNKIIARVLAFLLCISAFSGLSSVIPAFAAKAEEEGSYVDTSGYESLAEIYKDYFRVGSACEAVSNWNIKSREIGTPEKEALISSVFNSITCGNEMKPAYNFDPSSEKLLKLNPAADEMMKWADDNGLGMRGHVLVWHSQCSPGFFCKDYKAIVNGKETKSESAWLDEECLVDRDTLIERMRTYIYAMIEYTYKNGYADTIYAWDVVNEATDDSRADGLRESTWYRILGPDYLYYAFLFAREAEVKYARQYASEYGLDPEGDLSSITPKLFYNDYNEWMNVRVENIIRFLTKDVYNKNQGMVKSDVIAADGDGTIFGDGLIDGIGMQGHLTDTQNLNVYKNALEAYSAAVGEVHITELDVGCSTGGDDRFYRQAQFYYDFFSMLVEERKNGVNLTSVTIWGLTDATSWRAESEPLLFFGDLTAKPAFKAVALAGKGEEFTVTIAESLTKLGDKFIDFEPYKNTSGELVTVDAREAGVLPRNSGHLSRIMLAPRMNHTPDQAIGYGAKVYRDDRDANVMIDISPYSGRTVEISLYVMTEDKEITIGLDGAYPYVLGRKAGKGTGEDAWVGFTKKISVPEGMTSAFIYVETDGTKDIYLDDISVKLCEPDGNEIAISLENLETGEGNNSAETVVLEEGPSKDDGSGDEGSTEPGTVNPDSKDNTDNKDNTDASDNAGNTENPDDTGDGNTDSGNPDGTASENAEDEDSGSVWDILMPIIIFGISAAGIFNTVYCIVKYKKKKNE